MNIEEYKAKLESDIQNTVDEREKLLGEVEKVTEKLTAQVEQKYALDETMAKVVCGQCGTKGWVTMEDGKKHTCPYCLGRGYIWAQLYMEEPKESD